MTDVRKLQGNNAILFNDKPAFSVQKPTFNK